MGWSFDGTNDKVEITDASPLSLDGGDWSISLWYYLHTNNATTSKYIFSWGDFNTTNSLNLLYYGANHTTVPSRNRIELRPISSNGTNLVMFPFDTNPGATGVWHHVVVWQEGTTVSLQFDGRFLISDDDPSFNGINRTDSFNIGVRSSLLSTSFFNGYLAEFFKINRALTSDERISLYRGLSPIDINGIYDDNSWYIPMYRSNYKEYFNKLTLTNDGSTESKHPPVRMPMSRGHSVFVIEDQVINTVDISTYLDSISTSNINIGLIRNIDSNLLSNSHITIGPSKKILASADFLGNNSLIVDDILTNSPPIPLSLVFEGYSDSIFNASLISSPRSSLESKSLSVYSPILIRNANIDFRGDSITEIRTAKKTYNSINLNSISEIIANADIADITVSIGCVFNTDSSMSATAAGTWQVAAILNGFSSMSAEIDIPDQLILTPLEFNLIVSRMHNFNLYRGQQ